MYQELFKFIGKDKSLGYRNGNIYLLAIATRNVDMGEGFFQAPSIVAPATCPYGSWNKFFENWERI